MPRPIPRFPAAAVAVLLATCAMAAASPAAAWGSDIDVSLNTGSVLVFHNLCSISCKDVVTVTRLNPTTVEVRDTQGVGDAGTGCAVTNATTIQCTTTVHNTLVKVGLGDDSVAVRGLTGTVFGGMGKDRIDLSGALTGVTLENDAIGNAGDDTLVGSPGFDRLEGEGVETGQNQSGNDVLSGGGGDDLLDGGVGR